MSWSYEQAEDHVLALEQFGMRFGLDRIRALLVELGSPQDAFESIHVVGSNGKSSTVRMTAALLAAHGVATGAYLSPHLHGYHERIRIGERDVAPERFAGAVQRVAAAAGRIEVGRAADDRVTQFETLTAAAFLLLAEAGIETAVVEAGLGGRHDATNVLARSRVQVLTNVALEHTQWLGDTIAAIAREKLDVVQPGATLVVGADLHPDALAHAERVCGERSARLVVAPPDSGLRVAAAGEYQRANFAVALTAAREHVGAIDDAIARDVAATVLVPGRFDVRTSPGQATVVLDGAHNPHGAHELTRSLSRTFGGRRLVAVISILDDKDARAMVAELGPAFATIVCAQSSNARAMDASELAGIVSALGTETLVEPEPHAAMHTASRLAGADGVVVATGSLYLLADLERPPGAGRVSSL